MNMLNTTYQSVLVDERRSVLTIKLNRPEEGNSINTIMVEELMTILNEVEKNQQIKVVVLEGEENVFCTGMDFKALANGADEKIEADANAYYNLLQFLSLSSKVTIAKVDGKVNAGGIGLVAACDIVIASEKATFGLSELLFGLLPACVMPFLIKRTGPQKAKWLALITEGISAQRSFEIGLVDEVTDNTKDTLRRCILRLTRLENQAVFNLKDYMSKLWIIKNETQTLAVNQIASLVQTKEVHDNIVNFIEKGKFPWNK